MNDTAAGRPRQFLADLTLAMNAAAASARQSTIEQCHSQATSYNDELRARKNDETAALREAAETDLTRVREWSRIEIHRTRQEAEERIALRRRQLDAELQECSIAVDAELRRVDERVQAFEGELARFVEQLLEGTDPASYARIAAQMPDPPNFDDPDPAFIVKDLRSAGPPEEAAAPAANPISETSVDRWWMDSPASIAARIRRLAGTGQPG